MASRICDTFGIKFPFSLPATAATSPPALMRADERIGLVRGQEQAGA